LGYIIDRGFDVTTIATIIVIYIAAAICVGVALGFMASKDGGSFVKWLIYGALLPFIAIPKAISIMRTPVARASTGGGYKKCMYCRKKVKFSATHCPKCGYEFIDWS